VTLRLGLVAAVVAALAATAGRAQEVACVVGPFDAPDRVVREGRIELAESRTLAGAEVYLSNTSLRVGGGEGSFVLAGSEAPGAGGRLRLQARTEIVLGPGFHAQRGSRLEASIVALERAKAEGKTQPADSAEADRARGATETVVRPDAAAAPPDPYRIPPMAARRRAGEAPL
jgi:hypothetical protein